GTIAFDERYSLDAAALDKLAANLIDGVESGGSPGVKARRLATLFVGWSVVKLGLDGSATFCRTATGSAPSAPGVSRVDLPVSTMDVDGYLLLGPAPASPIRVFAPRNTVLQTYPESSRHVATLAGNEERIEFAADRFELVVRLRLAPEWARNDVLAPAMTFSLTDQAHWLVVAIGGLFAAALSKRLIPSVDRAIDRMIARARAMPHRLLYARPSL